jgi:hypothetical protein
MRRTTTLAFFLLTGLLTLPAHAHAATFCVHVDKCLAEQVQPDLQAALKAAERTPEADLIAVGDDGVPLAGPFRFPTAEIFPDPGVTVRAVSGRPLLTAGAGETVLDASHLTLEGFDIDVPDGGTGAALADGGLDDVMISGGDTSVHAVRDTTLTRVRTSGARVGVAVDDPASLHADLSRLSARSFAVTTRGLATVTRSVLRSDGEGVLASGGGLTLDHDTVAAPTALDFHLVDIPGRANLSALALTGRIVRDTSETGGTYPVAIRDSVWDASHDLGGPFDEAGDAHIAPVLTPDLHPRGSSAQVDRDTKTDGRYSDLDGVRTVGPRADAGAFEYQRRAPVIDALTAEAPAFSAVASDADGDALRFSWDFGDGSFATGAQATHAYAAPGIHNGTLLVTDEAGLTATRAFSVTVAGTPAQPAPAPTPAPVVVPPARDTVAPRLTGVRLAADRLRLTLSEAATVRIAVAHRATITRHLPAGRHTLKLHAKHATITVTDAAGNRTRRRL